MQQVLSDILFGIPDRPSELYTPHHVLISQKYPWKLVILTKPASVGWTDRISCTISSSCFWGEAWASQDGAFLLRWFNSYIIIVCEAAMLMLYCCTQVMIPLLVFSFSLSCFWVHFFIPGISGWNLSRPTFILSQSKYKKILNSRKGVMFRVRCHQVV